MQFDTAATLIRDELSHPQAHALATAIRARREQLRDQDGARSAAQVVIGADVRLRDNLKEAYLRGLTGTVAALQDGAATVLFDEESTSKLARLSGKRRGLHVPEGVSRYAMAGILTTAVEAVEPDQDFAELVTFVIAAATRGDLDALDEIRRQRITDLVSTSVKVGAEVTVTDVSPKYLAGLTGTVESVDTSEAKCVVLLDEQSTDRLRWDGGANYTPRPGQVRYPVRLKFTQMLITSDSGRG